ncbi:AP-3 complex subunit beta [Paragonimus westermani]|uniref:AP-3 complex subunit beta n=1 Tax=Paragonimus westermani TaxID=34504 RepID=A0A5J4NAR4_9TREM|nr:AP-3 complex subunit beta [Paragonimus westermani]
MPSFSLSKIRKLVYVYLTRYAEEQQDIALLSISTFQRSLKDPNPLIRASALRVLSSIRIRMLIPIIMLAIQDASKDVSPYVRKVAAHATLKVYSLDPDEKSHLVEVIELLLADKTTLVIGSAVHAFEEICPERLDLIHSHYRKICSLLMDVDEWGQVVILHMLTRYARTQLLHPGRYATESTVIPGNTNLDVMPLLAHDLTADNSPTSPVDPLHIVKSACTPTSADTAPGYSMSDAIPLLQADCAMLLNTCRLLLQSRNSEVVLAVGHLIFALQSKVDYAMVVQAFIRCLHGGKEVQYTMLCNIASLAVEHHALFEPYQRTFYAFANDPLDVKLLKLDILTNLATETTSPTILREFQHYVSSTDPRFVIATIQAIGRCASAIPQIAEICLNGLVRLMSRPDEKVVAECVVILRKLLQLQSSDHREIIVLIAQLTDTMTVPSALASILWLLGEYSHRVPRIAPDVLRKMAKSFSNQEPVVKLQVLNLAAKLCIVNPRQTQLLTQYVFNLARYDLNYDIRDRSRLLRALIFPQSLIEIGAGDSDTKRSECNSPSAAGYLARHARKICLAAKPAPTLQSDSKERSTFKLGTLSHLLNKCLVGYQDLPEWPAFPPNPWSRVIASDGVSGTSADARSPLSSRLDSVSKQTVTLTGNQMTSLCDFFSDSDNVAGTDEEGMGESDEDLVIEDDDGQNLVNDGDGVLTSHSSSDVETRSSITELESALATFTTRSNQEGVLSSKSVPSGDSTIPLPVIHSQQQQWWLDDISTVSETEDTDDEEDEEFDYNHLLALAQRPQQPQCLEEPKETHITCSSHSAGMSSLPLEKSVCAKFQTTDPIVDNLNLDTSEADAGGEVSRTSGTTLHTDSAMSSGRNAVSSYPPSPSVALDSALCSSSVDAMPTPLPTVIEDSVAACDVAATVTANELGSQTFQLRQADLTLNSSSNALHWIQQQNPTHPYFRLLYQFSRIELAHNPNLAAIRVRLINQDDRACITDISLDLTGTALGRLLLDAKRIEPFCPVERLPPNSEHECSFGLDFAGFTDSVEISLVYRLGSSDNQFWWSVSITPPAGELIRPCDLDEDSFFRLRGKPQFSSTDILRLIQATFTGIVALIAAVRRMDDARPIFKPAVVYELLKSRAFSQTITNWDTLNVPLDNQLPLLIRIVLSSANMTYCFSKSHQELPSLLSYRTHSVPINSAEPNQLISLHFAAETISDHHPCLIELSMEEELTGNSQLAESASPWAQPTHKVHVTVLCPCSRFRSALTDSLNAALCEPNLDLL